MFPCTPYSQHLMSARGIALGGFTGVSAGSASVDWNPAGLVSVRDWELGLSNFLAVNTTQSGFALESVVLAKRLFRDHAAAVCYAPGKLTEFLVPTTFSFGDSSVVIQTTFDQRISYQEPFAIGYAYRPHSDVSVGFALRLIEEKVTDTKYFLDTNSTIRSETVDFNGSSWSFDLGSLWSPDRSWTLGLVFKNLLTVAESQLPDDAAGYRLDLPRFARLGIVYQDIRDLLIGLDGDTEARARVGVEWLPPANRLAVRAACYADARSSPVVEALSVGLGGAYDFIELDVSYLKFLSGTNRRGTADLRTFDVSAIKDVEYNPFASDRLSITVRFHLGRTEEMPVRIEGVRVLTDVYPAWSITYSYTPVGTVRLWNTSLNPVETRVSFSVEHVMDAATESKPVLIPPGERADIPFYAIFNDNIRQVTRASVREGNVTVTARVSGEAEDRYQAQIVLRGRNDWNGDAGLLKYFITPDDPEVLKFTRSVLKENKDRIDTTTPALRNFLRARVLFDEFAGRLSYVNDPKKTQDFVQYPSETLALHGGDCDDMTVCYSSLLAGIGVATALVDVVPPNDSSNAHIYAMFDTGIEPQNSHLINDNPKRYVVRRNMRGTETLWIPVETTVITKGFDEAWRAGAREYYDDVELNLGLAKGWLRVIDIPAAF